MSIRDVAVRLFLKFGAQIPPNRILGVARNLYFHRVLVENDIDLVLDVGANIGQFAKSLRAVGYRGEIVSFEPVAAQFAQLSANADSDPRWTVLPFALGEVEEDKAINVMRSSVFSSFNAPSVDATKAFSEGNSVVTSEHVSVRRLDTVLEERGLTSALGRCLLKSDTQGFDLQVLRGAGRFLNGIRLLQIELSVIPLYEGSVHMAEMLRFLDDASFVPVGLFPVTKFPDWGVIEFDYLGINRRLSNL